MILKRLPKPVVLGIAVGVVTVAGGISVPLAQKFERDRKLHEAIKSLNVVESKRLVLTGAEDRCYAEKEPEHPELNLFMLQHGSPEVLDVLVRRGLRLARPLRSGPSPMQLAVGQNNLANVRYLIEHGVDVNGPFEVNDGSTRSQSTPLVTACGGFTVGPMRLPLVKLLLDAGAEVNKPDSSGRTPLHVAPDPDVLKELLRRGAAVETRDKQGRTPLLSAISLHHSQATRILLDSGANIKAVDNDGRGALHLAEGGLADFSDPPKTMLQYLLGKGADVIARDLKGQTPLHRAVERRNAQDVRTLVAHGANPRAKDVAGVSPRDLVRAFEGEMKERMLLALAGLPLAPPNLEPMAGGGVLEPAVGESGPVPP